MAEAVKQELESFKSPEDLSHYLHHCVNTLETNPDEGTKKYLQKFLHDFYRQRAVNHTIPLPEGLPKFVGTTVEAVYSLRQKDIINSVVKGRLMNLGHTIVDNYDWKLKWVVGSSKLASIREPVCQIELRCLSLDPNLGPYRSLVNFECNLEDVEKLIDVLKKVKEEFSGGTS